jgi:PKD repeat protein
VTFRLTVTDQPLALSDTDDVTVTINDVKAPPVAALAVTPLSGDSPLTVAFDGSGSYGLEAATIVSYTFDFGDGSPVTQPSPTASHVYAHKGTYDASLRVTDSRGNASTLATAQVVISPGAPVANLAVSPPSSDKGDPVTLDAGYSTADEVAAYTFDPGDGSGAITVLPPQTSASHVYHRGGSYTVTLSVRDTQDVVVTTTATISVRNTAPVAALDATPAPTEDYPPLAVSFDASGSYDPDAAKLPGEDFVESYAFDFGDGSPVATVSVPSINHTYNTPGTYDARVVVHDHEGKVSANAAQWTVRVLDHAPVAALGADRTAGAAPLSVVLDGAGSSDPDAGDGVVSYRFDFGDGSAPITRVGASSVQHIYSEPGTYTASLTVQDSFGTTSAPATLAIEVGPVNHAPVARATADKLSGDAPLDVVFDAGTSSDADSDAIVEYTFDFGDGSAPVTRSVATAAHTYASAGRYPASVIVKDARGAVSNADAVTITVTAPLGENTTVVPFDDSKGPFSGALPADALLALGLLSLLRRRRGNARTR